MGWLNQCLLVWGNKAGRVSVCPLPAWLHGYLVATKKSSSKPRQRHVIKPYTHLVKTKELIWKVWRWPQCVHVSWCELVNVVFTLPTLSLEETSSRHSHHILNLQHKSQTSLLGHKLDDTFSFLENWEETHIKASSLCVALTFKTLSSW